MNKLVVGAAAVMVGSLGLAQAGEVSRGEQVFNSACVVCHGAGVAGAPKVGDKDAWRPRIAKGLATLQKHALNGFQGQAGVMPAKGGRMDLSDDDVKQAVAYMVAQGQ